jgi:hypothetical protein
MSAIGEENKKVSVDNNDGNRRAQRNSEFRQQLYKYMMVEKKDFLTVTMHMLQRGRRQKRRENGIEIWR